MKYILLIIISGQIYAEKPGLSSYEKCTEEKRYVFRILNRLKADGHLSFDAKITWRCQVEE